MSDFEDVMVAGGIVWIVSSLIKGLVYLILGIIFICYLIVVVCRGIFATIQEIRENWPQASSGPKE